MPVISGTQNKVSKSRFSVSLVFRKFRIAVISARFLISPSLKFFWGFLIAVSYVLAISARLGVMVCSNIAPAILIMLSFP